MIYRVYIDVKADSPLIAYKEIAKIMQNLADIGKAVCDGKCISIKYGTIVKRNNEGD